MTDLQRELLAIVKQALDPRWWVLALLVWATRDLVLAGGVLGVVAAAKTDTVREITLRALK